MLSTHSTNRRRAIGYLRTLADEQPEGSTARGTLDRLRAYAEETGLTLQKSFRDEVPSNVPLGQRDGWSKVLKQLKPGDALLVTNFSELFRSPSDAWSWMKKLAGFDIALHVVDAGGEVGMESPLARAIADFASLESERVSERAHEAQARLRAEGRFTGGRVPFGWTLAPDGLVPNAEQQRVLALMRELYDAGQPLRSIAASVKSTFGIHLSHGGVRTILSGARRVDASPYVSAPAEESAALPPSASEPQLRSKKRTWKTIG